MSDLEGDIECPNCRSEPKSDCPTYDGMRFCNQECIEKYKVWSAEDDAKRERKQEICHNCGTPIGEEPTRWETMKFCDKKCLAAYQDAEDETARMAPFRETFSLTNINGYANLYDELMDAAISHDGAKALMLYIEALKLMEQEITEEKELDFLSDLLGLYKLMAPCDVGYELRTAIVRLIKVYTPKEEKA